MGFESKVNAVIGKEYDAKSFHCYDLVNYLLPGTPILKREAKSIYESMKNFKKDVKTLDKNYEQVDDLRDKDILLLGNDNNFYHIGVYYKGRVIHNRIPMVVSDKFDKIEKEFKNIKVMRCKAL